MHPLEFFQTADIVQNGIGKRPQQNVIYTIHTFHSISYQNWGSARKQFPPFLEYNILGYNRWLLTLCGKKKKTAALFLGVNDKQVLLKLY